MRALLFLAALLPFVLPCYSGLSNPVAQASELAPIGPGPAIAPQGSSKDVAVNSILQVGPPFVNEGGDVVINIGVANNGTEEEVFTVRLRDDTANEVIFSGQEMLAAGGSTTIVVTWNTAGATGGPPPPGPPTPGTIHVLTALVELSGDTAMENNSLSLLPGIWVIAAPEPAGITFPEKMKEPEAITSDGLASEAPAVDAAKELLEETYVSPVSVQRDTGFTSPSVSTAPAALTSIFRGATDSEEGLSFAKPEITTVAVSLSKIMTDDIRDSRHRLIALPQISTARKPLTEIFLYQPQPSTAQRVSGPAIATPGKDLTGIFGTPVDASEVVALIGPYIDTDTAGPKRIVADESQTNLMNSLAEPDLTTVRDGMSTIFDTPTEDDAEGPLTLTGFSTAAIPLEGVFQTGIQASLLKVGTKPDFVIQSANDSALEPEEEGTVEPEVSPEISSETGAIRGRIKLQGRNTSLGGYIEIGNQVTFVDRQGYFLVERPAGAYGLTASAPGYLSHVIGNITVEPEHVLALPTMTLGFGDADGNGVIDIYDLALAAGNYGNSDSGTSFR